MRITAIVLLLSACAASPPGPPAPHDPAAPHGPTVVHGAAAAPPSEPAASDPQEPCAPSPKECAPAIGWIGCDDCDGMELVTRDSPGVLVACLEQALRCGPDAPLRARYAEHGKEVVWTEHFYLRAAIGLGSLAPMGTAALVRSRAWRLPRSATQWVDRQLGGPRGLVPPAGNAPCAAPSSKATPVQSALHCFRSRIKPAVLALGARDAHYYFGRDDYRLTTYRLTPKIRVAVYDWASVERNLKQVPDVLMMQLTALGDRRAVTADREWVVVELQLRSDDMPADGDVVMLFVIDSASKETVFAYSRRH